MSVEVVGVGDCRVSSDPETVLATYALGSCIGVMIYDPVSSVGGLLHFMLPASRIDPAKAQRNPYVFADTGIPLLFRQAYALGAEKGRLMVSVAGGAQVMDGQGVFNIGRNNYVALRRILWQAGVLIDGECVGGSVSRTVRLHLADGRISLRTGAGPECDFPLASPGITGVRLWK